MNWKCLFYWPSDVSKNKWLKLSFQLASSLYLFILKDRLPTLSNPLLLLPQIKVCTEDGWVVLCDLLVSFLRRHDTITADSNTVQQPFYPNKREKKPIYQENKRKKEIEGEGESKPINFQITICPCFLQIKHYLIPYFWFPLDYIFCQNNFHCK